jgi:hypothetical protein
MVSSYIGPTARKTKTEAMSFRNRKSSYCRTFAFSRVIGSVSENASHPYSETSV